MKYQNTRWDFEMTLPESWHEPKISKYMFFRSRYTQQATHPEFYGPRNSSLKIAVGPINPIPPVETQQENFQRIAIKYGHSVIEIGRIAVSGRDHATMISRIPLVGEVKTYSLIFGNYEYLVTAKGSFDECDTIVESFRTNFQIGSSGSTGMTIVITHKIKAAHEHFESGLRYEQAAQWDNAFEQFDIVAQICQRLKDSILKASAMEAFARAYQSRVLRNKGEIKKALDYIECANRILGSIPDCREKWFVQVETELVWGTLYQKLPLEDDKQESIKHFRQAINFSKKLRHEFEKASSDVLSFDFPITSSLGLTEWQIVHVLTVGQINLAEMLLYKGVPGKEQANQLADDIIRTANKWKDWKLLGGGTRIKGEIAFLRGDLSIALDWFDEAIFAYKRGVISPETFAAVQNRIREIETRLTKYPPKKRFKYLDKVPKLLVLLQRPFLRGLDKRASAMPASEAWQLYRNAAIWWDDAGWRNKTYEYLTKAVKCLDYVRANMPLKGDYPSERRSEFYSKLAQQPLERLIQLLLSSEAKKIPGLSSPVSEAFYYREKLGAIGLLDELEASKTLSELMISYATRTGQFEQLEQLQEANWQSTTQSQKLSRQRNQTVHIFEEEQIKQISKIYENDLELHELVTGNVCQLEEIQQFLPDDTALIEYALTDHLFAIFVITHNAVSVPVHESTLDSKDSEDSEEFKKTLTKTVEKFIHAVGHPIINKEGGSNLSLIKKDGLWLYNVLLRPTESIWKCGGSTPIKRLIIIPQSILHRLPFSALFDGEKFVAEKLPTVQSPSASVLRHCYQKRSKTDSKLTYFGFANPESDFANPELEDSSSFEKTVFLAAKRFGFKGDWQGDYLKDNQKGILGVRRKAATYSALLDNIERYTFVDLETHGKFSAGNPLRQGLVVWDDDGTSRYLTAREVFLNLRMRTDLLVAAMCNSGQVELPVGDELVGFVRAFMFAGCRSLLVYPWLLLGEAAETFLREFYENLIVQDKQGVPQLAMTKDKALQLAQIRLIELGRQGKGPSGQNTWEHPNYWAWTLIGDYV